MRALWQGLAERDPRRLRGPARILELAMNDVLENLYVHTLQAKLALTRVVGASLMYELESPKLTLYEKRAGFRRWVEVTQDGDVLAFMLELIRRKKKEHATIQ